MCKTGLLHYYPFCNILQSTRLLKRLAQDDLVVLRWPDRWPRNPSQSDDRAHVLHVLLKRQKEDSCHQRSRTRISLCSCGLVNANTQRYVWYRQYCASLVFQSAQCRLQVICMRSFSEVWSWRGHNSDLATYYSYTPYTTDHIIVYYYMSPVCKLWDRAVDCSTLPFHSCWRPYCGQKISIGLYSVGCGYLHLAFFLSFHVFNVIQLHSDSHQCTLLIVYIELESGEPSSSGSNLATEEKRDSGGPWPADTHGNNQSTFTSYVFCSWCCNYCLMCVYEV